MYTPAMSLASRLQNLGTETAFAVSLAAADWAAKGNRVFPFHLGDMNLPTPANVVCGDGSGDRRRQDRLLRRRRDRPVARGPGHRRRCARRGMSFEPGNVVVQPGGKPVIGKFVQTVMEPGAEVLYPNPGYPIYESQIEYFGGDGRAVSLCRDADGLRPRPRVPRSSHITPRTTALIYNDLQNPCRRRAAERRWRRSPVSRSNTTCGC